MKTVMPTRELEQLIWSQGSVYVAGVDEVGRGPLAGPVTVAAVVLPTECVLEGARDSKLLTHLQRQTVAATIRRVATCVGIGWASSDEIDDLGLTRAMQLAASRAIARLEFCDHAVLDGSFNYLRDVMPATVAVKADQSSLAVAAASIIAKMARDNYMLLLDRLHPEYGFAAHKGYGTAQHLAALQKHGITPYHRQSFRPVREAAHQYV